MVLLSFSRLRWNIGGSLSEIQVNIERYKSAPIDVRLSSPESAELIVPHTSRLVRLTIQYDNLLRSGQIVEYLCYLISTLHVFCIIIDPSRLYVLEFHSDFQNPFFLHPKKLETEGMSLHAPHAFPHVTELTLCTNPQLAACVGAG